MMSILKGPKPYLCMPSCRLKEDEVGFSARTTVIVKFDDFCGDSYSLIYSPFDKFFCVRVSSRGEQWFSPPLSLKEARILCKHHRASISVMFDEAHALNLDQRRLFTKYLNCFNEPEEGVWMILYALILASFPLMLCFLAFPLTSFFVIFVLLYLLFR